MTADDDWALDLFEELLNYRQVSDCLATLKIDCHDFNILKKKFKFYEKSQICQHFPDNLTVP